MKLFRGFVLGASVMYLTACGGSGQQDVQNVAPSAVILKLQHDVYSDEDILLDGRSSIDNNNDSMTYTWTIVDQPANSKVQFNNPNSDHPTFSANVPGFYTVQLVVNDGKINSEPDILKFELLDKDSRLACDIFSPGMLEINTDNSAQILKESYVNAALLVKGVNQPETVLNTEIKGRGNSTWGAAKKPYRLKLKKKSLMPLYEMPEDRNWALLANAYDGTMLRNSAALCLGQNFIRNSWTPNYRFVDVKLNGSDKGLYLMTEHVAVSPNKVDLKNNDVENDLSAEEFFIEMTPEGRLNAKDIYVKSKYGTNFEVKSDVSKDEEIRNIQLKNIKNYVDSFEEAIYSENLDPNTGYAKYIDIDSAVDYILLNELFKDNDRFWASTHFHKPKGGKLIFGPIWDYDLAAGGYICNSAEKVEGWWVSTRNYPKHLFKDPVFRDKALARWEVLSKKMPNLLNYIDLEAKNIQSSQVKNYNLWPLPLQASSCGSSGYVFLGNTYDDQVSYLKNWLNQRSKWMDEQFKSGNF